MSTVVDYVDDFITVAPKARPSKMAVIHANQPPLIPEKEFQACYETKCGENKGWLNIADLSKSKIDVAKMIIRGIFSRYESDKRSGIYRAPQFGILYALRVQILLRAFLPNDAHYKSERTADYSRHLGRTIPKSSECSAILDGFDRALRLQARSDKSYMQVFTETDKMFWQLRYKRWIASGAQHNEHAY